MHTIRLGTRWAISVLALTLALALAWSPSTRAQPPAPAEDPGHAVMRRSCLSCHGMGAIASAGFDKAGWTDQVQRMIGASLPEPGMTQLVDYLASTFPPLPPNPNQSRLQNGVVSHYRPVTEAMLLNPDPGDWIMSNRTYDSQRFSPLKQVNTHTVGALRMAWSRGLPKGMQESIPLVHDGVVYAITPGAGVEAIDGVTGDLIWQYQYPAKPAVAAGERVKSLLLYQDVLVFPTPDDALVGLDARTGKERWRTGRLSTGDGSAVMAVGGKVISGRTCIATEDRAQCFIAAHDALTGKELWRFYTVPKPGDPGSETWAGADLAHMTISPWGAQGSYDPQRNLIYWGVANPTPYTRIARHGRPDGTSLTTPADLYSNSSLALDADTGKLKWYYQHLPGDDWDMDFNEFRILARTTVNPDPATVKWINPDIPRGAVRDVVVNVGEGGGVFALDRANGQFLWASPFPYDTPSFLISGIDPKTGRVYINYDVVMKTPGDRHTLCYLNTTSYWPSAYSPRTNAIYVPYVDNCLDMTAGGAGGVDRRVAVARPGSDPERFAGIAKIDIATGHVLKIGEDRAPDNGAVLATDGGLIFHGDLNRRLRAFDAATGAQLWQAILGGPISNSTITYAIHGKQYVLVMTGDGLLNQGLAAQAGIKTVAGHNEIYAFALP